MTHESIVYSTDNGIICFGNDRIELRFEAQSGRWLSLTDRRDDARLLDHGGEVAPILLTVNGRTMGSRGFGQMHTLVDQETIGLRWAFEGAELTSDAAAVNVPEARTEGAVRTSAAGKEKEAAAWLTIRLREGDWRVELLYGLRPHSFRVTRRVRIAYVGEGEALLRHFILRLPFARLGPPAECCIEAPGHPLRPGRTVASLGFGSWGQLQQGVFCDAPAWRPPLIGIHHDREKRAVALWAHTETEPFYPLAERLDQGVLLANRVFLADRFAAGHTLEWGAQYVEVFHEAWLEALARFQTFYDEVGLVAPADVPEWAESLNLYEVHVGELTGTGLIPYPTYEDVIADLEAIRDKGFNAVYIMPHMPLPGYSVIDYLDIEIQQGSEAGFRAFIAHAHELGLKVFMDVTLHGVLDRQVRRVMSEEEGASEGAYPVTDFMPEQHPYVLEHPDWFSRHELGALAQTYTYSFDHASPSWQDFMARVFRHYVEEYDIDGFRVNSHTWNFFPNWARDLPRPASASFYGSAAMFKCIRAELKALKPDVVLYTETPGPLLHTSHELSYNYDETWLLLSLLPLLTHRGLLCHSAHPTHVTTERLTAHDMAQWMAQRKLVMPRGAIKVRHLDCHDTYWFPREFRRAAFGPEAALAVVALFAFLDGGFMDYNGADVGYEPFYRRVMHLRQHLPVLQKGTCDYLAVPPDDWMVFAPLREWKGRYLLPVIRFDNRSGIVGLPLPIGTMNLPAATYEVWDHMADERINGPKGGHWHREELAELKAPVEPYGVLLLDFRPLG